ncbi:hypothetical protein [Cellulomonas fengjieae]|uniref:Uncharacterized protein n=1 Tax=Cellulomonas fengjieae TaxID=2819978 RepID=A0ABS3SEE0_9CELL|nr:hypothetical protein [Cellulomonas fengjieae]MBO3084116.1 hypothetical protein [Cellulomonas fengjieae]QVI64629.1 hypothetical protein KG102_10575 [Cellulomonas fengjieae]
MRTVLALIARCEQECRVLDGDGRHLRSLSARFPPPLGRVTLLGRKPRRSLRVGGLLRDTVSQAPTLLRVMSCRRDVRRRSQRYVCGRSAIRSSAGLEPQVVSDPGRLGRPLLGGPTLSEQGCVLAQLLAVS